MLWTYNNYSVQPYYNWARWYPNLAAYTWYDVYVHIPDLYTTTSKARYWVSHAGGYSLRVVNQDIHGGDGSGWALSSSAAPASTTSHSPMSPTRPTARD